MTDKPTPTTDLLKRCAEIHEWRSTGVLSGEALRDYAKRKWPDRHDTLQMAEHETVTEALALLAKWRQPAVKGDPVAWLSPWRKGQAMTDKPTPTDAAAPECLTCSDHGAVGNILTAEPCPDCTRWNVQPAPATQQAGATKEHVRLVRVIADKIEDGTLFRSGIYSNKDLARFVRNVADAAAPQFPTTQAQADSVQEDAARYRWLAEHCRSTREHWGGRWSIVVEGPAPKSHDSEDDLDAAIDAAMNKGGAA